jgi:hypothetical protein
MKRFNLDRQFGLNLSPNGEYVYFDDVVKLYERRDELEAELAELKKPGYILVPIEPDDETIDRGVAFYRMNSSDTCETLSDFIEKLYKHMLAR